MKSTTILSAVLLFGAVQLFSSFSAYQQLADVNAQWEFQNDIPENLFTERAIDLSEVPLIQKHLSLVEEILRSRDVSHLTKEQVKNRIQMLDVLNEYWNKGVFPQNLYHKERTPYFIDHLGTHCAVGHLLLKSGFGNIAKDISEANNYIYVKEIEDSRLIDWSEAFGFTVAELAWIQPAYQCYGPELYLSEFKYAQSGPDVNEMVEVISSIPLIIGKVIVELFDENGNVYYTDEQELVEACELDFYSIWVFNFPENTLVDAIGGIGISSDDGFGNLNPRDFISYGGVITAQSGVFDGMTSENAGITQDDNTSSDLSISLIGPLCDFPNTSFSEISSSACSFNPGMLLPVELVSFEAEQIGNRNAVSIEWETALEIESKGFHLMKSENGVDWRELKFIDSKSENTGPAQYNFEDREVKGGKIYYYQLVQEDLDGRQEKFEVRSVHLDLRERELLLYPNPVSNNLINLDYNGNETSQVQIYSIDGKLIHSGILEKQIDVRNLQAGLYILEIQDGGKKMIERFVKN